MPPQLSALFDPRPTPKYLEPQDIPPEHRKTLPMEGVASYLPILQKKNENDGYVPTETMLQRQKRKRDEKRQRQEEFLKKRKAEWDPKKDLHVRGDPYKTLFLARLPYKYGDEDVRKELERYGPLERVRVVTDKNQKSRGYAFAVFEHERDREAAKRDLRDKIWAGRKILVDTERGRTDTKFKPRSLGGGLGGRGYTKDPRYLAVRRDREPVSSSGPGGGGRRNGPPPNRQPRFRDGPPPQHRDREPPRDRAPRFRDGPRDPRDREPRDSRDRDKDRDSRHGGYRDRDERPRFSRR